MLIAGNVGCQILGPGLTESEKSDLVAFLGTL